MFKGRPFDSEGGEGWNILSGQIIYFQHELDQKIYFQVYQGQTIYFYPQQNFEKAKKQKTRQKKPKRGGGQNVGSEGCQNQDRIFHGIFFYFCTLPGSVCAYIL